MAISREEISNIAQEAAKKVIESQGSCISAGMTLVRDHDSFKKATPIIFRVNLQGLVSADDLKVPHSELAIHTGAAGKKLIAFALTGNQTGIATYDEGEGRCGFISGLESEVFRPPLVEKVNQMWEKRGPGNPTEGGNPSNPNKEKLTRDDVRVEVWEERDRLHIGIQNKETGDYLVSWWDDDAREMFEQGFFKSGPRRDESVLSYAEERGILKE